MGPSASHYFEAACGPTKLRVLMGGINHVGKTSVLYYLKSDKTCGTLPPIPTIGFNMETIESGSEAVAFNIWEFGGFQMGRKDMYRYYMDGTVGYLYVVDSTGKEDLDRQRDDLQAFLALLENPASPVLIYFNKQDVAGALAPQELSNRLGISDAMKYASGDRLATRSWRVQPCSAATGDGIKEGFA